MNGRNSILFTLVLLVAACAPTRYQTRMVYVPRVEEKIVYVTVPESEVIYDEAGFLALEDWDDAAASLQREDLVYIAPSGKTFYYLDGLWYRPGDIVVMHKHRPGCGHILVNGVWMMDPNSTRVFIYPDYVYYGGLWYPYYEVRAVHVHGPGCGHIDWNDRWFDEFIAINLGIGGRYLNVNYYDDWWGWHSVHHHHHPYHSGVVRRNEPRGVVDRGRDSRNDRPAARDHREVRSAPAPAPAPRDTVVSRRANERQPAVGAATRDLDAVHARDRANRIPPARTQTSLDERRDRPVFGYDASTPDRVCANDRETNRQRIPSVRAASQLRNGSHRFVAPTRENPRAGVVSVREEVPANHSESVTVIESPLRRPTERASSIVTERSAGNNHRDGAVQTIPARTGSISTPESERTMISPRRDNAEMQRNLAPVNRESPSLQSERRETAVSRRETVETTHPAAVSEERPRTNRALEAQSSLPRSSSSPGPMPVESSPVQRVPSTAPSERSSLSNSESSLSRSETRSVSVERSSPSSESSVSRIERSEPGRSEPSRPAAMDARPFSGSSERSLQRDGDAPSRASGRR